MKFTATIVFVLCVLVTLGQEEYSLGQFYGKELGFTQGSYRSDSIRIEPLEKMDTVGIMYSDEKREKFIEYYRTTRFGLDSAGAVINYRDFINCPLGEWLPTLLKFEIRENKIFMLVEYNFWGKEQEPRLKEYFWRIEIISNKEILLVKQE